MRQLLGSIVVRWSLLASAHPPLPAFACLRVPPPACIGLCPPSPAFFAGLRRPRPSAASARLRPPLTLFADLAADPPPPAAVGLRRPPPSPAPPRLISPHFASAHPPHPIYPSPPCARFDAPMPPMAIATLYAAVAEVPAPVVEVVRPGGPQILTRRLAADNATARRQLDDALAGGFDLVALQGDPAHAAPAAMDIWRAEGGLAIAARRGLLRALAQGVARPEVGLGSERPPGVGVGGGVGGRGAQRRRVAQ